MATTKVAPKARTVGSIIDTIWKLREDKRALEAKVKIIEAQIAEEETLAFAALDKEQVTASRGSKASISISEAVNYNIQDFDEFTKYVKKTGYFHLFQRRLSVTAVREIFEQKKQVPGLVPFTKRTLNVKTL